MTGVAGDNDALAPFVRVVVLNWNSGWFVARCVRSLLLTEYPPDRFEVVLVDNASIDGSRERLAHDFPELRLIANEANLGFGEGCNRAMRDLEGVDHVALVNSDAVVEPGWLMPLVQTMATAADVGAVCPKILLETPYRELRVDPGDSAELVLERVSVDGFDVTRRVLTEGVTMSSHPTLPLEMIRRIRTEAVLRVPVTGRHGDTCHVELHFTGASSGVRALDVADGASSEVSSAPTAPDAVLRLDVPATGRRHVNSLGTDLTPGREGFEVGFGELDDDAVDRPAGAHEVIGWSGGGVLLRVEMLRRVGLFDPRYFAYYEDTDLAWRSRRQGWRTRCQPASVLHHLHGGSVGATARPFFFLNYRNWLLTALRNGTRADVLAAGRLAGHLSWPYLRRNVIGRLRRGWRPHGQISAAWGRVFLGVAADGPAVLRTRRSSARPDAPEPIGAVTATDVVSRWMPASSSRAPAPRLGGPTIVYLDVTETLRSGWRAGIQRVTCELARHLPTEAPDLELVPIVFEARHGRFRRISGTEYAELLAPTHRQRPPSAPAPMSTARRLVGRAGALLGLTPLAERIRARRAERAEPPVNRALLLDRLEPGSILLDADAAWNVRAAARAEILPALAAQGVRIVQILYDVLPVERPEWFEPTNAGLVVDHLRAHAAHASLVIAISEHTATGYREWLGATGQRVPRVDVVTLGTERPVTLDPDPASLPEGLAGAPFLLAVGTVEPRKNHATLLDGFADVVRDHPELHLVVVGRPGWRAADTIDRLRELARRDPRVHWLDDASDPELEALYRAAFLVVAPSYSEGFGLPVIEALARGATVLSSDGGALPEAGGDSVEYFDPTDAGALATLVRQHLDDPTHHAERRRIAAATAPRRWAEVAAEIGPLLGSIGRPAQGNGSNDRS